MNKNITIWCTYHKKQDFIDYNLCDSDIIKTYYTNDFTLKEDNINYLNKYLSEIVTYYYVWKNQIKTDYVGFCHYRRHFSTIKYDEIDNNHPECFLSFYIKPNKLMDVYCLWGLNLMYDYDNIFTLFKNFISINDNIDFDEYLNSHLEIKMSNKISYILTWKQFNKLCKFIFGFLDYINEINNVNWKDNIIQFENSFRTKDYQLTIDNPRTRDLSVLMEFLIAIYINIIYETSDDNGSKYMIISSIDNEESLIKFYKKNVKTGIRDFYNYSSIIKNVNNLICIYMSTFNDINIMNKEIKNMINIHHKIPLIINENEYINCKDSIDFNKDNYTINENI